MRCARERYRCAAGEAGLHPEEERRRSARSACRPGRTSWSARWCACCLRRTTSRSSPTVPTGSGPAGAATPRCGEVAEPGPGRPGSSRVTSPTASGSLDHRGPARDPGGEDPRQPVPAADQPDAEGGLPGGLDVARHAQRLRRKAASPRPSSATSTWTGSTSAIEQRCYPSTTSGRRRRPNPGYRTVAVRDRAGPEARGPGRNCAGYPAPPPLPSQDPDDPGYRRLRYVRYADDCLLGFAGPRPRPRRSRRRSAAFLRDELRLELSAVQDPDHPRRSQAARFLGYEIRAQHCRREDHPAAGRSTAAIGLFVPRTASGQRCART